MRTRRASYNPFADQFVEHTPVRISVLRSRYTTWSLLSIHVLPKSKTSQDVVSLDTSS